MNKADNLPMSINEFYKTDMSMDIFEFAEKYANYLLSHHINVLAERIADNAKINYSCDDCDIPFCDQLCMTINKKSIQEIAKDYINELNLQISK